MQYLRPVGGGPSVKTWPRWESPCVLRTSTRFTKKLLSKGPRPGSTAGSGAWYCPSRGSLAVAASAAFFVVKGRLDRKSPAPPGLDVFNRDRLVLLIELFIDQKRHPIAVKDFIRFLWLIQSQAQ